MLIFQGKHVDFFVVFIYNLNIFVPIELISSRRNKILKYFIIRKLFIIDVIEGDE